MTIPNPTPEQIRQLRPASLAYLGDAVYELYIRRQLLFPPQKSETYHQQVVERVRATAQALTLAALSPYLSEQETEIVRWGRNGCNRPPRHLSPADYQQASGFETLLGYLSLSDPERLQTILDLTQSLT